MLAVIAGAYLQHNSFRITSLVSAAVLGICTHFLYRRPRATTVIMAISAVAGLAFLFLG